MIRDELTGALEAVIKSHDGRTRTVHETELTQAAWALIQELRSPAELAVMTRSQLALTMAEGDQELWHGAGADAMQDSGSFDAYENLAHASIGMMQEGGFPPVLWLNMVDAKLRKFARWYADRGEV